MPWRSGGSGDGVGELTGFGHISLNLDVHASVSPSPDSPDLHGQTQRRGKVGSAVDGV